MADPGDPHAAGGDKLADISALATLAATPFAGVDEAIDATLVVICDLFGVGLAMVQRLDGETVVVTHACDRLGLGVRPLYTIPRRDSLCDRILATMAPLIVPDADADPRCHELVGKRLVGTRTYLGVPILLDNGQIYGALCAHDRRVHEFGAGEIATLLILARLIASQLARAEATRAAEEIAATLARRNHDLARAVQELRALDEIVESISSELDLGVLLERVVASAVRLLGAYGGAISLVGDDLDAPRRLTATHNLPGSIRAQAIPSHLGLMGQVIAARGPVIVERYKDLAAPLPDDAFHALAPWIAVPIWWQDEIVGTFGIGANDPDRRFDERDGALLAHLAKHAAVAIENARLYAASRELGVVEERNRLAREIHDTLAQSLLALTFQLRTARELFASAPDRALDELAGAEQRTRAALAEARRSVWNLGPVALESGTLVEALQGELAAGERAGLPGRLVVSGAPRPLTGETQLALFRVAQEALTNVRRHAQASAVELTLDYGADAATLTISDDGRGFDPVLAHGREARAEGRYGLLGMGERLRGVGGRLEIESTPGHGRGTSVRAVVPYEPAGRAAHRGAVAPVGPAQETARIRVAIADDQPALRAGIAALLADQPDIAVVAAASDGEEALRAVERLQPDILLLDLRMPKLGGVEVLGRLAQLAVPTRAIAVTTFAQDELVLQALRAGARGYLLKDVSAGELVAAVRTVHAGGAFLAPRVADKLAAGLAAPERLTAREREVLQLLSRGLADKEIAARIGTSAKTASFHVANLVAKLGAQNRADAVRLAYARGLLDDEQSSR